MLKLPQKSAVLLALLLCAGAAYAEPQGKLQPLPPPPSISGDDVDEPTVTITKESEQTVEEYRANGRLYMIKITPAHGVPYYLVDSLGDGKFARQEGLDSGVRVPRWVLKKF